MSVAIFCVKVNVIYSLLKVDRFSFRNADKAKIDTRFFVTPQGKDRDSFDPRSQNLLGKDSTWMVDRLRMPRIILMPRIIIISVSEDELYFVKRA